MNPIDGYQRSLTFSKIILLFVGIFIFVFVVDNRVVTECRTILNKIYFILDFFFKLGYNITIISA